MSIEQPSAGSEGTVKTAAEERRQKDAHLKRLQRLNPKEGRLLLELAQLLGATHAQTFDVFINELSRFTPGDVEKIATAWSEVEGKAPSIEDLSPEERKAILDEVVSNIG